MCEENIGGVTFADVIKFQVKLMMGSQYDRVIKAEKEEDIVVACLRVALNDAFRHVTKNQPEENIKKLLKLRDESLDDYICNEILRKDDFLKVFISYANAEKTSDKVDIINEAKGTLLNKFAVLKVIDDNERKLCFGHIQKLFNMAIKYYLCLYFCKDYLELNEKIFLQKIKKAALEKADCPVDSVILNKVGKSNIKWSKIGLEYGTDKYIEVQEKIKENKLKGNGSNLSYDFKFWQEN